MTSPASRREFMKRASALSITGAAAPWALSLAAMGEAAAANATGYKALVCVFLYGGNDYANTVVTYDQPSHNIYLQQRPALATARADLLATALRPKTALPDARAYALAPQLASLLPYFNDGSLAVMLNLGTLIEPLTKAQYTANSGRRPPMLFSHNDQQSYFQANTPEGATSGWGGRMGDLFAAGNGNATFTSVSVSGSAVFLSGKTTSAYQVSTGGAVPITAIQSSVFGSDACRTAMAGLISAARPQHLFEDEYTRVVARSIRAEATLTPALATASVAPAFPVDNRLAAQLSMVSRMIAARQQLGSGGPKRQVFFVSLGGFDTHDALLADHPGLLSTVGSALAAFQTSIRSQGLQDSVTTFTASDFGRTLNSDGDGSDHGWGSMHFVLGGAVKGQDFYGRPPVPGSDGPDDVGRGRLLPTLSVDQYGATLGRWFGLTDSELLTVMPNLKNFSSSNLGFMA